MSHGEAFLWIALNRFRDQGLYILDEPEAALSPQRQLTFLARMHQLIEGGSQFVIATHAPILMAYPESRMYLLDEEGYGEVRFQDTDHYLVTRAFLQNPSGIMGRLFRSEPADEGAEDAG